MRGPAASRWTIKVGAGFQALFSRRCPVCELDIGAPVCENCQTDFFAAQTARCRVCAARLPSEGTDTCGQCLRRPPQFDATIALADYLAPVDRMITALKFGHRLSLGRVFGELLQQRLAADEADVADVICPAPLSFERESERGFNQAHEIGRHLRGAARYERHLLLRTRHTAAQMTLALDSRRRNVRGAFAAQRKLDGLRIAVVDDVMTTGSTLDEIARELKRAGAARVINLVVARTP